MKRKAPILLSALIVCLTFVFVANFSGVSAIEDGSETNVTTTKTTTVKVETTTKLTWPWQKTSTSSTTVNVSSVLSSIGDELTGKKPTTTSGSETHSESGSETEKPVKPGTTAKATTTRKVTTTVKRMTVTVVMNTTIPGGTMDPLSAYYSRLSETDANGELIENVETTDSNEPEERETSFAVTIIIAVAAMLIAISLMTGFFSLRNKRLAEKEAAQGIEESDEAFSGDVIISKKPVQPDFTHTVVDDEDDISDDEPRADEAAFDKTSGGEDIVPETEPETETAGDIPESEQKSETDSGKKDTEYDDIFSGRDDI